MAIDTAAKRSSAINVGSPWRSRLPFPDGTIDQGDRQAVAFVYSGILAVEFVPPPTNIIAGLQFSAPRDRLDFAAPRRIDFSGSST